MMSGVHALRSSRALQSLDLKARPTSALLGTITRRNSPFSRRNEQAKRYLHWQSVLGTAADGTRDLILGLHSVTGTPWYITIPLVAVSINVLFRLPFIIHQRRLLQRRARLTPLLQAWQTRHQVDIMQKVGNQDRAAFDHEVTRRFTESNKRISARLGLQEYKLYSSILGLPFWIIGADAIRRICGADGVLPTLLGREPAAKAANSIDGHLLQSPMASDLPSSSLEGAAADLTNAAASSTSALDPSLVTGGLLWFPDLTVADPYHILPFVLSAVMVFNVTPKSPAGRRILFGPWARGTGINNVPIAGFGPWRQALMRTLFLFALCIGPITLHLPAAIHLYWISSSLTYLGLGKAVTRAIPIEGSVKRSTGVDFSWLPPGREWTPPAAAPAPTAGKTNKTAKGKKI